MVHWRAPKDAKKQAELLNLRQRLETAVRAEDYESAAKLRDKINQLE
jgi:protein-arginine kinase activator protein McsA